MGIRFLCPTCGKRINVKEQQAGLRGFCPKCGAGVDIPLESTLPGKGEQTEQEASTMALAKTARTNATTGNAGVARPAVDPLYELPTALWYALPPGAPKPYGPIDATGLAQWFYEKRLSPDSMVWREDWPEWRSVADVWPNWSPGGAGPGGEPMIDPPADGGSYKLKAVKAQSVAQPPVIATKPGGTASRGLEGPVAATLGGGKGGAASAGAGAAPAVGSAVAGGGVYYRRRKNGAYLTTVAFLMLIVLALGGVMVWVIMRDPPPKPKTDTNVKPGATTPSSTGSKLPPLENPTFTSPTGSPLVPKATPSASPSPKPATTPAATPTATAAATGS